MKNYLSTLILILLSYQIAFSQYFTKHEISQDLNVVKAALMEAHPGLYRYNSRSEIARDFKKIEESITNRMTVLDFYRLLCPMLANIGDGHTKLHLEGKPDDHYAFFESGYLPMNLYFHQGKSFLHSSYVSKLAIPLGSEILSINGKPMKEVTSKLMKCIFADARITSAKYAELSLHFSGYYAEFIGPSKFYKITFKNSEGRQGTITVPGVRRTDIPKEKYDERQEISYPNKHTAMMRIGVFRNLENKPTLSGFLQNAFEDIQKKNISSLIIDIRNNEGGMDAMGIELFSYLAKSPFRYYGKFVVASDGNFSFVEHAALPPEFEYLKKFIVKVKDEYHFTQKEGLEMQQPKAKAFTGRVFILQNGRTFSVSSEFCAIVRETSRGIFIGDETGGAVGGDSSGGFALVRLPNTKLKLDIPLLGYYMHLDEKNKINRGVLPDYSVLPTINEILSNKDVVFQKALDLAK